ncbi:MAG: hypothetical protein L6E13_03115 [Firmicutes bacterium]|nr:hypothetical protein [Bacillota bacterium]
MALVRWDDLLATVADALANWGQPLPGGRGREFRDFSMDFQVDDVEGLPAAWPDPAVAAAAEAELRRLVDLFGEDPLTRDGVVVFPAQSGERPPVLLTMGFSLRDGTLDMTLVFRAVGFPEEFAAWLAPALHYQERLAGLVEARRGRVAFFTLNLFTSDHQTHER